MNFKTREKLQNIENAIAEIENAIYTTPEIEKSMQTALKALAKTRDALQAKKTVKTFKGPNGNVIELVRYAD